MCCFGGADDEPDHSEEIFMNRPGRRQNPDWDPNNEYDYPKYIYDKPPGINGAAGRSQQGGYQPNPGMPHQAGSRQGGGQNNPYATGNSAQRSGPHDPRNGAHHRDNESNAPRGGSEANASGRNRNQGAATAMHTAAPGRNPTDRYIPDDVPRRPSPPPLRRRR